MRRAALWVILPPILLLALLGLATSLLAFARHYAFNVTPSMPIGLYRLDEPSTLVPGVTVLLCLPNAMARDLPLPAPHDSAACGLSARPLFKRIAAVPGDAIDLSAYGVRINGHLLPSTAPPTATTDGRAVAPMTFSGRVPEDHYFVLGMNPRSLDGRYFGLIHRDAIAARATLVFTPPS